LNHSKYGTMQQTMLSFMSNLMLSNSENKLSRETFEKIDTAKNGFISYNELKKALKSLPQFEKISDDQLEEIIEAIDTDGDDRISFSEYLAVANDHSKLVTKQNIERVFRIFDKNGNG